MKELRPDAMTQIGLHGFDQGTMSTYTVIFDGGSKGNPGRGYGSFKLFGEHGEISHEELTFDDRGNRVTNNEAEYLSLIAALKTLSEFLGDRRSHSAVQVYGDSLLVISQLRGQWKVKKAELRPLHAEAGSLLRTFGTYDLQWHDRSNSVSILGH